MNAPLVSVCVPIYNGAEYLDACLAGIASQTFSDFEVLIVDDCSNDGGVAIARRWASNDSRFKVHVNTLNLGLVGNWNRCIKLSAGKWIKFLFQDDLIESDCLAQMLHAGNAGCGFVACARQLIFEGVVDPTLYGWYVDHKKAIDLLYGPVKHLTADAYSSAKLATPDWNIVGEPSVTMIERRLFDEFGLFDPLLVQVCDSEMWNRLGSNVGVDYVAKEIVSFRVHQGSASQANSKRRFRAWVLDEIVELNRLCYAPDLKRFRRHAKLTGKWRTLQARLMRRVNAAFEQARQAQRERPSNPALMLELHTVFKQLPGYAQSRFLYALYRLRGVLRGR